jgi:hypothetical protein
MARDKRRRSKWWRQGHDRGRYTPDLWFVWLVAPIWVTVASVIAWVIYLTTMGGRCTAARTQRWASFYRLTRPHQDHHHRHRVRRCRPTVCGEGRPDGSERCHLKLFIDTNTLRTRLREVRSWRELTLRETAGLERTALDVLRSAGGGRSGAARGAGRTSRSASGPVPMLARGRVPRRPRSPRRPAPG